MAVVTFNPAFEDFHEETFGQYSVNPTPEVIKDLIFNLDASEWSGGSGDNTFNFENGKTESQLKLYGALDGSGFLLQYNSSKEPKDLTLTNNTHSKETGEVGNGGDAHPIYRKYIVSKETAWKAIEHFLQSGERLDILHWEKMESPENAYV